jgi:riboflavin kinase/FMN adenylyltransferase
LRIVDGFWDDPRLDRPTVLTFGKFDALHLGHRAVFQTVLDRAKADNADAAVLFLDPHPLKLIDPERCPASLTSLSQKFRMLEEIGFDIAIVGRFDERLRELPAEAFLARLVGSFQARAIAVGYSVRFGYEGRGNLDLLREQARALGYDAMASEAHTQDGVAISSTRVRDAIANAEFDAAASMLGRPYALAGEVVEGAKMGRELGFPTANVAYGDMQLPPEGIYAGYTYCDGKRHPSAISLGNRPTFDGEQLLLESYLLDFAGDLYGTEVEVEFVEHLRDQEKFDSVEELIVRIHEDVKGTRAALRV